MIDNEDLEAAVRRGLVTEEAATKLRGLAAERRASPGASEEWFGAVAGLADVMAAAGVLLLGATVLILLAWQSPIATLLMIPILFLAAEHFTRKRRLPLTSLALFGLFALGVTMASLVVGIYAADGAPGGAALPHTPAGLPPVAGLITAGGLMIGSLLWWLRYHLPIAVASTALAAINAVVHALRMGLPAMPADGVSFLLLLIGIGLLVLAMRWDMTDVRRETARADIAFWLHAMAGFQLAGATFRLVFGVEGSPQGWERLYTFAVEPATPLGICVALLIFLGFLLLCLAIDRRSLLISSLIFLIPAVMRMDGGLEVPLAAALAGALLITLSVAWLPLRSRVLARLPVVLQAQLPRTELAFRRPRPVH